MLDKPFNYIFFDIIKSILSLVTLNILMEFKCFCCDRDFEETCENCTPRKDFCSECYAGHQCSISTGGISRQKRPRKDSRSTLNYNRSVRQCMPVRGDTESRSNKDADDDDNDDDTDLDNMLQTGEDAVVSNNIDDNEEGDEVTRGQVEDTTRSQYNGIRKMLLQYLIESYPNAIRGNPPEIVPSLLTRGMLKDFCHEYSQFKAHQVGEVRRLKSVGAVKNALNTIISIWKLRGVEIPPHIKLFTSQYRGYYKRKHAKAVKKQYEKRYGTIPQGMRTI